MVAPAVAIPQQAIAEFCRRHRIVRLAIFGSVLREDFTATSDVDVLVTFAPGSTPGFRLIDLQDELSTLFGSRRVDLVTERFLNRRIRESVLRTALVVYNEKTWS